MSTSTPPFKVLVVDDSAVMRRVVSSILARDPALTVVGTAHDPYDARTKIKALEPDVLTLDIEMPRMDGLSFLENLMRLRPMPVVMVSSLTERGADATLAALELGAVDFLCKNCLDVRSMEGEGAQELVEKVKAAAGSAVGSRRSRRPTPYGIAVQTQVPAVPGPRAEALPKPEVPGIPSERLIALGASTGGPEALAELLEHFHPDMPATVIAQHIPAVFSARFAERLDKRLPMTVREARDGDPLLTGHIYVAPGGFHLRVARRNGANVCQVTEDPPINRHRPSVDALFHSVAELFGAKAIGVILTGMGADGAEGLLAMSQAGAYTVAQDEASSVVWGMPREASRRGAARELLPLHGIGARVREWSQGRADGRAVNVLVSRPSAANTRAGREGES